MEQREEMKQKLIRFIGYGSSTPMIVFCGLEEASTEHNYEQTLEARIRGGGTTGIMDLGDFKSERGCEDIWKAITSGVQHTWRPFIKLLMAIEGQEIKVADCKTSDIKMYQSERFGRTDSNHLLTELFPLPKASRREMPRYWNSLYPAGCHAYYSDTTLWEARVEALRQAIYTANPVKSVRLVVCYGKTEWPKYHKLFGLDPGEDIVEFSKRKHFEINRNPVDKTLKVLVQDRDSVLYVLTHHPARGLSNAELQAVVELYRHYHSQ